MTIIESIIPVLISLMFLAITIDDYYHDQIIENCQQLDNLDEFPMETIKNDLSRLLEVILSVQTCPVMQAEANEAYEMRALLP